MAAAKLLTSSITLASSKGSHVCSLYASNIRIKGPDGAITIKDSDADAEGYPLAQNVEFEIPIENAPSFGGRTIYFGGTTGHTVKVIEMLVSTSS